MICNRFVRRWARLLAFSLAMLVLASQPALTDPADVRAAPPGHRSGAADEPASADTPVRAYDQPARAAAKFYTIRLTAVNDDTNQPLSDVEVRIVNQVDGSRHLFRTDSRGRLQFECPSIRDQAAGNIEVRKDGYVPLRYGWGFEGGPKAPGELTLKLRRGITMGGIVVAAADRPVEGVTVVMTVTRYGPAKRSPNPTGLETYYEVPSRTGPDGRWRTDSVPPGAETVHLQLIHPDYVCDGCTTLGSSGRMAKVASLRDQSDRQVLLKGMRIDGRVLDVRGRPIAGARIADSTRGLTFLEYVWRADTDAEGRFHIHLPRGKSVKLTVQVHGYEPATQQVAADPDRPSIEFRLPPGQRLRGRIVDPRGHPIAGAQVVIPSIVAHKGIYFNQRTDAQGRFEWDSAPAEPVSFRIAAEGYLLPDDFVRLTAGDNEAIVVLKPAVNVRLEVVDARTGQPIPAYVMQIGTPEPGTKELTWGEPMVMSRPHTFSRSFESEKGPYQFKITAEGYAPCGVVVPAERTSVREVVKLEKAPE